jgi:plastocyanin
MVRAGRPLFLAGSVVLMCDCSGHASGGPVLHRVTMRGLKFDPDSMSVAAGDTVEWLNKDIVPHTSTAQSAHWNSQLIQPNDAWRTVLTIPGSEIYGCLVHPTMKAKLEVH